LNGGKEKRKEFLDDSGLSLFLGIWDLRAKKSNKRASKVEKRGREEEEFEWNITNTTTIHPSHPSSPTNVHINSGAPPQLQLMNWWSF
jgi:hypothetical protein